MSATPKVHLWSPKGASWLDVPGKLGGESESLLVRGLRWAPDGSSLALVDKTRFAIMYSSEAAGVRP